MSIKFDDHHIYIRLPAKVEYIEIAGCTIDELDIKIKERNQMIKIYGKDGCSSCNQAKMFCQNKGLEYEYLSLGKDYQLKDFIALTDGSHRTFPLIMNGDAYIGTYENLKLMY